MKHEPKEQVVQPRGRGRFVVRALVPIAVLAAGVVGAVYLIGTKPQIAPEAARERTWTVEAVTVSVGSVQPELRLYGNVVAGREVEMRALVEGQVVEVGPNFSDGGVIRAGDLLAAIDPFDYQANLDEIEAQLNEARARRAELVARRQAERDALERDEESLALHRRDLERSEKLHARGNMSDKAVDLAKMELAKQAQAVSTRRNNVTAETARIAQQDAAIKRLEVALRRARHDLDNTRVVAPFDGFLRTTDAEIGMRLGVRDRIAELVDADSLEVAVHVSNAQYGDLLAARDSVIGRRLRALWHTGGHALAFNAVIVRVGAVIDAATGGVDLYARITDAGADAALRPGAFVEVLLPYRRFDSVVQLPEAAVYDGQRVYVIDDGRLVERQVTIATRTGDDVLVTGDLADGQQVVITRFTEIGPGVKIQVR